MAGSRTAASRAAGSRACALLVVASLLGCGPALRDPSNQFGRADDGRSDVRPRLGRRSVHADRPDRKPRSDTEFRGKLMIMYFGYTFCPDVCPTRSDGHYPGASTRLSPPLPMSSLFFITIDPERDTKVLADYVAAFPSQFCRPYRLAGRDPEGRPIPTRRFMRKRRASGAGSIRSTTPGLFT